MTSYHYLGLLLACIAGGCFLTSGVCLMILKESERIPLYCRKLPRKSYPAEVIRAIETAYDATGDIKAMLLLLQEKWKKGVAGKGFRLHWIIWKTVDTKILRQRYSIYPIRRKRVKG